MIEAEVADILRRFEILAALTEQELKTLSTVIRQERYDATEIIFVEGAPGSCCYFIAAGSAVVSKRMWDGSIHSIATLHEGELFGQLALVDGSPRSATCRAGQPCLLLRLDREDFDLLFNSGSPFAFKFQTLIAKASARQLRLANRRINAMLLAGQAGTFTSERAKQFDEIKAILAKGDAGERDSFGF